MGILLVDSPRTIIKKINDAAIRKILKSFYDKSNIVDIESVVRTFVLNSIKESEVWQSLSTKGGESLVGHFGIPKAEVEGRLETILDIWGQQIKVSPQNIKRRPSSFIFSYTFKAIRADWASVLNSEAGITINISKAHPEGQRLPWLEWLLTAGDQLEITGYDINFGRHSRSRSGQAIMIKANTSWVVPPKFGGFSTDNNFVTRALDKIAKDAKFRSKLELIFKAVGGDELSALIRQF